MDTMTYASAAEVTRTVAEIRRNRARRVKETEFIPLDLSLLPFPQAGLAAPCQFGIFQTEREEGTRTAACALVKPVLAPAGAVELGAALPRRKPASWEGVVSRRDA